MGRDVLWRHPSVLQYGDRGKDRNYDDGDSKNFRHNNSLPTGFWIRPYRLPHPALRRLTEYGSRIVIEQPECQLNSS